MTATTGPAMAPTGTPLLGDWPLATCSPEEGSMHTVVAQAVRVLVERYEEIVSPVHVDQGGDRPLVARAKGGPVPSSLPSSQPPLSAPDRSLACPGRHWDDPLSRPERQGGRLTPLWTAGVGEPQNANASPNRAQHVDESTHLAVATHCQPVLQSQAGALLGQSMSLLASISLTGRMRERACPKSSRAIRARGERGGATPGGTANERDRRQPDGRAGEGRVERVSGRGARERRSAERAGLWDVRWSLAVASKGRESRGSLRNRSTLSDRGPQTKTHIQKAALDHRTRPAVSTPVSTSWIECPRQSRVSSGYVSDS